jgi:Ser/Thr protein kinase RdoA (MazF antagonist)
VLASSPNVNEFTNAELNWLRRLDARLTSYLKTELFTSGLSETLVHGDLSFGNFQVLGNGEMYWFDFACRFYGPRIHDLARLTRNLYAREPTTFERFDQMKHVLLAGYQSANPLTDNDLRALTPFTIWYTLASSHHYCRIAKRRAHPTETGTIRNQMRLAEYLLATESRRSFSEALGA